MDGTHRDLLTGEVVDDLLSIKGKMPFYGVFVTQDGVRHDLTEIGGGGGGGAVSSVNGKTGVVLLKASDIKLDVGSTLEQWYLVYGVTIDDLSGQLNKLSIAIGDFDQNNISTTVIKFQDGTSLDAKAVEWDNLIERVAALETAVSSISVEFANHVSTDDLRWAAQNKSISDLRAELKQFTIDTYAGTTPKYDYSHTQTILMAGGLVSLVDQGVWTAPVNGAIQAQVGGLLGAGLVVLVNGEAVWTAPLNLVVPLNSPEIQINAGDEISYSGVVGLGQTIQVDFFPNKGA